MCGYVFVWKIRCVQTFIKYKYRKKQQKLVRTLRIIQDLLCVCVSARFLCCAMLCVIQAFNRHSITCICSWFCRWLCLFFLFFLLFLSFEHTHKIHSMCIVCVLCYMYFIPCVWLTMRYAVKIKPQTKNHFVDTFSSFLLKTASMSMSMSVCVHVRVHNKNEEIIME